MVENCTECPAGTWSERDTPTCKDCPTNSNSPAKSGSRTNCTCNAGAYGSDGSTCQLCQTGKYKQNTGSDTACHDCPAGKYSGTSGAVSSETCSVCPANSTSSPGMSQITSCVCNKGHTATNWALTSCTLCAAGKYKYVNGSVACTYCPTNSLSPEASETITDCTCNAGYTGPDGGPCTPCAAGTYRTTLGSSQPVAGNYKTLSSMCQSCPANSASPTGSNELTDCQCNAGYTNPCNTVTVTTTYWNTPAYDFTSFVEAPTQDGICSSATFRKMGELVITPDGSTIIVVDEIGLGTDVGIKIRQIKLAACEVTTLINFGSSSLFIPNIRGIAITPDGSSLFISDMQKHTIHKINVATGTFSIVAGSAAGFSDGVGTAAQFYEPGALVVSIDSFTIYVCDYHNENIRAIEIATGTVTTVLRDGPSRPKFNPTSIAVTPDGVSLIVATIDPSLQLGHGGKSLIRIIDIPTRQVTTLAGSSSVDNGGTNAAFSDLGSVVVTPDGKTVIVCDKGNNKIRYINIETGAVETLRGQAEHLLDLQHIAISFDGMTLFITHEETYMSQITQNNAVCGGRTCVQCARGTFKNETSSAQCSVCPANSEPNNASGATGCLCVPGYVRNNLDLCMTSTTTPALTSSSTTHMMTTSSTTPAPTTPALTSSSTTTIPTTTTPAQTTTTPALTSSSTTPIPTTTTPAQTTTTPIPTTTTPAQTTTTPAQTTTTPAQTTTTPAQTTTTAAQTTTTPAPTTTTHTPTSKTQVIHDRSSVIELIRTNITDYIPYPVGVINIRNMSTPENVEFTIQIELHDTNQTLDLVANTIRTGIANMTKLEYKCINITVITPRQRRLLQIPNYITFLVVITISVEDIPASDSDHVFFFVILIPSLFAIVIVCCIIFKCCKIQPPAGVNKNMSCPRYEFIYNPQHYEYPYDLRYINGFA
jgi:hypothetical protein